MAGVPDDDRVAGVGAAVVAHDHVEVLGQPVDDLALALIAPLQADDGGGGRGLGCPEGEG